MSNPAAKKDEQGSHNGKESTADAAGRGKNRTYPNLPLEKALVVAQALQDGASGMSVNRIRLAQLMGNKPGSSTFQGLLQASRMYELTSGGVNATTFGITARGEAATGDDEVARLQALRQAVLSISPYKQFMSALDGKRVPAASVCEDWLIQHAKVSAERAAECFKFMLADLRFVGFTREVKGTEYLDLHGTPSPAPASGPLRSQEDDVYEEDDAPAPETSEQPRLTVVKSVTADEEPQAAAKPKKVFIAHGKDRRPMEQVKKVLDQLKVQCVVAVDEAHKGRPISAKVASLMREECSSAIVIFTADERFLKEDDADNRVEVWRPSENVIYELGAASILYDRRIVIFKDKRVNLPSDFSDLGYIPFEEGKIEMQMGQLMLELVALDFLKVSSNG